MIEMINPTPGGPLLSAVPWLDQLLLVAVSSARFAFAFIFVPIFSNQIMPATVRNSIIITFGLVALAMQPDFAVRDLSSAAWALMLLKEAAAGTIIGLFFGTMLWAMAAAGEIIDTKVGATVGQLVDPISGNNTSLTGILFSRFSQIIFVSLGGITLLVGTVMQSYAIWPLGPGAINVQQASVVFFEGELGRLFTYAFIFSVPILTILYIIDVGMGFLNRFAQQFNVFSLSMPIKSVAATLLVILLLPLFAEALMSNLKSRPNEASGILKQVGKPQRPAAPISDFDSAPGERP
jgi:type III secretion protein T